MNTNFDLLGDPIPEGWGKRGRPPHVATEKNRNKVMLLLAMGWSISRIANAIGITQPTLRKNYFQQLRQRDLARDRLEGARLELAWEIAKTGNVGAMREFGKLMDRNDRMEVERELSASPTREVDAAPSDRLGKKQLDEIRARDADADLMAELEQEASQNARH
ncbi:Resolvase helix-turn-helix domain protein [Neorhizobium galegae bv. officinalis bv. officinalis str. HAMBI 1141]|uniref:Resolvase helix-turn-helix domain protein n=1 Tax=Neorhizobium galegae bv. officinalis bv. officinalis str. HAMBI 1141 TaxID=1028801 RepID=A0A068T344_NEOGA|nr:hypothetical protein [Neorhizobium galegae]CDN52524.1 Resolvase helix-turn-helix domain protein [Neorhizobium galegae bv. officinalis bv. officinalis str. HAMBI 1141]